jgi:hypothetical protein
MAWEREIDGYEGLYSVFSNGEVWSINRARFMAKHIAHNGYYKVALNKNGNAKNFFIHRLVANAFLEKKPTEDHQVNHKDGIKTNNDSSNLEWVTRLENIRHAIKNGLANPSGPRTMRVKWKIERDLEIYEAVLNGTPRKELAAKWKISVASVGLSIRRVKNKIMNEAA